MYVHVPKEKRRKLDPKAVKCLFVGYDENVKGFRAWNPMTKKIIISRDVRLVDDDVVNVIIETEEPSNVNECDVSEYESLKNSDDETSEGDELESSEDVMEVTDDGTSGEDILENSGDAVINDGVEEERAQGQINHVTNSNVIPDGARRGNRKGGNEYYASVAMMSISNEPRNYAEAISSGDRKKWIAAMNEEYNSLIKNGTWKLVDIEEHRKVIDNRWVYKIKCNADGSIERYKARLVVRGFTQEYGMDYQDTFSPVVKYTSIRSIMAVAAVEHLKLWQFDVKTAFLYGELEEDVYMRQPVGFEDGSGRVCKLIKSLYGLKQASRCWNKQFTSFIKEFGFETSKSDKCVFVSKNNGRKIILGIYVDDGLLAASDEVDVEPVLRHLSKRFEIKTSVAKYFLGMEINRDKDGSIHLSQATYARKVLKRFNIEECREVSTPMDPNQTVSNFTDSKNSNYPYREAIGSSMYLMVATRPDIAFAIGVVSRFMEQPTEAHVNAVKRIMRYIKGTVKYGIRFDARAGKVLIGSSDADYAGDTETRRSTSGRVIMFCGGAVSWGSERQKSVSLSTTESEYNAGSDAVKELIWLIRLISDLTGIEGKPELNMDSQGAIRLVKNPEFNKRTKHIDIRYHFIREKYEEGNFHLNYVPTDEQLADIFTKALLKGNFQRLRSSLNIN